MTQSTYSDTDDTLVSSIGNAFEAWVEFESYIFRRIDQDKSIVRSSLLNVGAGRLVTGAELPFFKSFRDCYLAEPDDARRQQLSTNLFGLPAKILSERIEELSPNTHGCVDFVLCKYVLQHIETGKLDECFLNLKSMVKPGGRIGLFTSFSSEADDFYQLIIAGDDMNEVPAQLRDTLAGGHKIAEDVFNDLLSRAQKFSFIATHHFSINSLRKYFQGWRVSIVFGPYDVAYLEAAAP